MTYEDFENNKLGTEYDELSLKEVFEFYEYADGSPFGELK